MITELFLQNYIIYYSDILIIVIGILTYSEQIVLTKIENELKKAKINKILFIVHNLKEFTKVKKVKDYIKNILLKSDIFNENGINDFKVKAFIFIANNYFNFFKRKIFS